MKNLRKGKRNRVKNKEVREKRKGSKDERKLKEDEARINKENTSEKVGDIGKDKPGMQKKKGRRKELEITGKERAKMQVRS